MEIDEKAQQTIERLTGRNISTFNRVNSLSEIPEDVKIIVTQLASRSGGSIPAILMLRYISRCTLQEAIECVNGYWPANDG
jgi:hypothetical protein